ncbi:hypothetical protein [Pseudonocardia sp. NPDC049635]|uniref:hypothetical protein n=1 Tax=Pseudonocardia sp. NPDC049635 TaxID=3155506 RepID=UPI0033BFE1C8
MFDPQEVPSLGGGVTGLTAAAITGVAGPVVGGVAGAVAGRFAERLLTITRKNPGGSRQEPAASPQPRPARTPAAAMTLAYLDDLVADLAREFHIDESLQPRGVRVEMRSVRIPRRAGQRVTSTAFLNGKPRRVNLLHPDLVRSEIVAATNGNKAAENVTEELPLASEDDAARLRRFDYFPDIARELLARRGTGRSSRSAGTSWRSGCGR